MADYKKIAQKSVTLAAIMEGREKVETEELINNYPNGFEIDEIEYVILQKGEGKVDEFWAFHIKGTNNFAFSGLVLGKIFNDFLAEFEGDYDALYEDFKKSGGIRVKLASSVSKSTKRPVTTVQII